MYLSLINLRDLDILTFCKYPCQVRFAPDVVLYPNFFIFVKWKENILQKNM